jgi:dipeptidyl aminopeptidase/acylaminoacyl peptidase
MIGSRLGPYEVTAKLGEGGMGEVYRATDSRLKREVAIKVLPPAFTADPERLARFEREAQTLAALNHPNIAAIYGLEEADGVRALVMELVAGEDLSNGIDRGALPLEEALPIARQIAEALEAAHERARRFDPESAEVGEAVRLAEATPTYVNTQDRVASVSESGTLLVPSAESQRRKLSWLDRRGRRLGEVPLPKGQFDLPRISPDGRSVAIVAQGVKNTESDLWIVDVATEQARRLTFAAGSETYPVWSPDGASLVFQTNRRGPNDLWLQPATGPGVELALHESAVAWKVPTSWVGDTLAFVSQDAATGFDVWLLRPVRPGVAPVPLLHSAASESSAAISPDGNWLAFDSNESGRLEIYVVSLPDARVKYQVSTEGGSYPLWTQGGRELIYLTTGYSLAAVPVALGDSLAFGPSVTLFSRPRSNWGGSGVDLALDVSADGSRFVLVEPASDSAHTLIVVTNWLAELKAEARR